MIEQEGYGDLQAVYDGVAEQIGGDLDYLPWADEITQQIEATNRANFAAGEGPAGPWPDLSPVTIARKGHNTKLVDSHDLMRSLTEAGQGVSEAFSEPGQGGVSRGTDVDYARFHQEGTRRMPARPPVGMRASEVDTAGESLADEVVRQLKAEA